MLNPKKSTTHSITSKRSSHKPRNRRSMPHRHRHAAADPGVAADDDEEAPSPRPSSAGCYTFLRSSASRRAGGGYRRLDSAAAEAADAAVIRVEVGTTKGEMSVFHVDPSVLKAGPVQRLLAAAGRRIRGGAAVAVAVDALLFEHLLWLQAAGDKESAAANLSEIVEFYSQDDDAGDHGF